MVEYILVLMTTFGKRISRERCRKLSVYDIRETPLGWHHEEKGSVLSSVLVPSGRAASEQTRSSLGIWIDLFWDCQGPHKWYESRGSQLVGL